MVSNVWPQGLAKRRTDERPEHARKYDCREDPLEWLSGTRYETEHQSRAGHISKCHRDSEANSCANDWVMAGRNHVLKLHVTLTPI